MNEDTVNAAVEDRQAVGLPADSVEGLARAARMATDCPNKFTLQVLRDHVDKIDYDRLGQ